MAPKKPKAKKPKAPPDPAVTAWYVQFRDRLVSLRERAGFNQPQLAELLDIPLDSYKQIEGQRLTRFPLHKLGRLSLALRQPLEVLLGVAPVRTSSESPAPAGRRAA